MNAIQPPEGHRRTGPFLRNCFVQIGAGGACLDLMVPDWSVVRLSDVAWSLSRLPRFAGHTRGTYPLSVAEHSVMVAADLLGRTGQRDLARAGLLHDAHEAAIGDIPTPVKIALGVDAVRALEDRLQDALAPRFGLAPGVLRHPEVVLSDRAALATERRDLLPEPAWAWGEDLPAPWPETLEPVPATQAYARFLAMAIAVGL